MKARGILTALLLTALLAVGCAKGPAVPRWEIRDGKFYKDGEWTFLKVAKSLVNFADSAAVEGLIANLDVMQEKHFGAVELNCYWHQFDFNGDGRVDVSLKPLNRLIDAIYDRGMCPCLSVETYAVGGGRLPAGFWDRYPDADAIDPSGHPVSDTEYGFGSRVVSIFHEGYRETARAYIRDLASGIDTKKILWFETTVEPQYMGTISLCYSDAARAEYAKWRAANGIDDPASEMPEGFPIPQEFIENPTWNLFRAQFLAEWINGDAAAWRSVAGEDAYVAVDYLDASEGSMRNRCGNPEAFLTALTCPTVIQINWTWHLGEKHINQKAYDRVHRVMAETGRNWAVSEHMTFNGSDFSNLTEEQRALILENTLQQGTRLGWEFVNITPSTKSSFSLYDDDWNPKPTMRSVDDRWDYWMERVAAIEKEKSAE